jgi:aryl-alcohol dehydrogenase-like predicted oxidoreductase
MVKRVKLGDANVTAVAYGCMGLSQAYEPCSEEQGIRTLNAVLDMGYDHLDTAALYGFGNNEELLNKAIGHRRSEYFLASKCGLYRDATGKREINGRPEVLIKTCEDSLRRLGTDFIDLYYLHRIDLNVPVEESLGALQEMRAQGKIRYIGLSEPSPETLLRALEICPIAAVQSELSLWTRQPNVAVSQVCEKNNVTFVAYSPLGRGFMGGAIRDMSVLGEKDIRHTMPRFEGADFKTNLEKLDQLSLLASENDLTVAQLALAWVLAQGDHILTIPGTRFEDRAKENLDTASVSVSHGVISRAGEILSPDTIIGERWSEIILREVDSEQYRFA